MTDNTQARDLPDYILTHAAELSAEGWINADITLGCAQPDLPSARVEARNIAGPGATLEAVRRATYGGLLDCYAVVSAPDSYDGTRWRWGHLYVWR